MSTRTLVVGAGETAALVASKAGVLGYTLVGFLDDDPSKLGTLLLGSTVLGRLDQLVDLAKAQQVELVVFAIPSAAGSVLRAVMEQCREARVPLKTLSSFFALFCAEPQAEEVRPLRIDDLFRHKHSPVEVGMTMSDPAFAGKTVLVTGAGGSIGSNLCMQLLGSKIAKLVMLGHGENSIFEALKRLGKDPRVVSSVADIRDPFRVRQVLEQHRPHIVLHAAAHKHVGLMESNLEEAILNNVGGTWNLVQAAESVGVERFVMISTDKAVNPSCVMGVTKRVAEKVVLSRPQSGTAFAVVRFGNVLGTRGSVVPIFEERIARSLPLSVTDPNVERFFISVDEACFLVLVACCKCKGAAENLFVLDMGAPIKIVEVARVLLQLRGKTEQQCPLVFTGLVKGEKMSEELFHHFERASLACNGVFAANWQEPLKSHELGAHITLMIRAAEQGAGEQCTAWLQRLVPEYRPASGGSIAAPLAPAPWPHFEEDEVAAVAQVLKCGKVNYWTGNEGRLFEQEFATFVGVSHAVAVANGTVALELCLMALGIGAGDEVVVPCRTYVATASCVAVRGATPVVADVDPVYGLITSATIAAVLSPKTKAIIVVHIGGWPCEMDPILELARQHSLFVIEDCAQSHGALYRGKQVGSFGHCNAFSFCQDKIMTTGGEGGMLVTNDPRLWKRAWSYKDIGRDYDAVYHTAHPPGFRWLTHSFGTNWRLTDVQSAIGRVQLKKLASWVAIRRANSASLNAALSQIPGLRVLEAPPYMQPSYYKVHAVCSECE
jgi:FlaA1/EpsC-like NDP-sugar epimerase/dTDP-4-amino-4,6-dideoxygalactose transaminase